MSCYAGRVDAAPDLKLGAAREYGFTGVEGRQPDRCGMCTQRAPEITDRGTLPGEEDTDMVVMRPCL